MGGKTAGQSLLLGGISVGRPQDKHKGQSAGSGSGSARGAVSTTKTA